MNFDTVIIGGGLSGLVCGIKLSQQGQRCVIISSGQSALHFSSGSFDLLNTLPDGEEVTNPIESVGKLIQRSPDHPYAKLDGQQFEKLAMQAETFFKEIGIPLQGTAQKNHYRITPMGTLKPTWLSMDNFAFIDDKQQLPWKKVSIFNINGFLDFHPDFIADEFTKLETECEVLRFNIKALEHLRRNPSELRSTNIARVLDKHIEEVSQVLIEKSTDSDAIIFPACIGLEKSSIDKLKKLLPKPLFLIPTMPPSIAGIYTQQYLRNYFVSLGGVYMLGDSVRKADIENNTVKRVYSFNHGDIPFSGNHFILATGSYFSQGLIATPDKIYEPVFGLDVTYAENRKDWHNPKLFESQGYQQYGVQTDTFFRGIREKNVINNLYVTGAILDGFNPIKEGTGAGVSILSALFIANDI